jgi:hypothetical protein
MTDDGASHTAALPASAEVIFAGREGGGALLTTPSLARTG